MTDAEPNLHDLAPLDSGERVPPLPIPRRRETPEQRAARVREAVACLERIASRGGIRHIEDPAEWQREIRKDRPLPGRD